MPQDQTAETPTGLRSVAAGGARHVAELGPGLPIFQDREEFGLMERLRNMRIHARA